MAGGTRLSLATSQPSIRNAPRPTRQAAAEKETPIEQVSSFVEFFVWLLVFKTFFLPLFIIPTGSMAETLRGAHATHACPNCGQEYQVGFSRAPGRSPDDPKALMCPNCRFVQDYAGSPLEKRFKPTAGDRIVVHGWPYALGGVFGPKAWDVVVFKDPKEPAVNYIKRLIGLPGQKIEIINGDIWVDDQIARKPRHVQKSLWFPYFDSDRIPTSETPGGGGYRPRWEAVTEAEGWTGLGTREFRFDGLRQASAIAFRTGPANAKPICEISDRYGYNSPLRRFSPRLRNGYRRGGNAVTDVRLSCEVRFEQGDGFVELSISKNEYLYHARLFANGRVTLERENRDSGERVPLVEPGSATVGAHGASLSLAFVDSSVTVEVNERPLLDKELGLTRDQAVRTGRRPHKQEVRIAAEYVRAVVSRVRVARDVFYVGVHSGPPDGRGRPRAGTGNPLTLDKGEYFCLGDNSPESLDGRYWNAVGPHLDPANYTMGTVPADQMIGRAFFVYWPGFLPTWNRVLASEHTRLGWINNLLPDFGRIRWIH